MTQAPSRSSRWIAAATAVALTALAASSAVGDIANVPKETSSYVVRPQGACWMVDNGISRNLMVPLRTGPEFQSFVDKPPAGAGAAQCCDARTVSVCGENYQLDPTRTGQEDTISHIPDIVEGQCYRVSCQNSHSGPWRTLTAQGAAGNVLRTRSPSQEGAWVVQYAISGSTAPITVRYQCNSHTWSQLTTVGPGQCQPVTVYNTRAINCWPDYTSPAGTSGYVTNEALCRDNAPYTGPHLYAPGGYHVSSNSFSRAWGRQVLNCQTPVPC